MFIMKYVEINEVHLFLQKECYIETIWESRQDV